MFFVQLRSFALNRRCIRILIFERIVILSSGAHLFFVAGDELHAEFAGDIIDDRLSEWDVRVLGHALGFEANVAELFDQGLERHAVLEAEGDEGAHAVHEAVDGGAGLGHLNEHFAGLTVVEFANGNIAFRPADAEFVREGLAGVGELAAEGLGGDLHLWLFVLRLVLGGLDRRGALGAVAVNGDAFDAFLPGVNVGLADLLDAGFLWHVDRFGNCSGEEGLHGRHHVDVVGVVQVALAHAGLEGGIEHGHVFFFEAGLYLVSGYGDVFDGAVFFNVGADLVDGCLIVAHGFHREGDGLDGDGHQATAGKGLVSDEADGGFDAGGVAVHEEADGASGREHGDLGVAVAVALAEVGGFFPCFGCEFGECFGRVGVEGFGVALVQVDHGLHGGDVVLFRWVGHPEVRGFVVAGEGAFEGGELGGGLVGDTGHGGGDGFGEAESFVGGVGVAVGHEQGAEVGVAEAEGAEPVAVVGDAFGGVGGAVDDDFLRDDKDLGGGGEALGVEPLGRAELHEVQRGEVAGGVVEEEVFAAGVGAVLAAGAFAGVPLVDGVVELHAGVATDVGALGDFIEQVGGVFFFARFAIGHALSVKFAAFDGGIHEGVAGADGEVFVLVFDGAVGVAVEGGIVAFFDEGPGLALFDGFGGDEFFDVGVPVFEHVHLGGAAGFATALHDTGHGIVNGEEGEWAGRTAAAGEFLAGGADAGEVGAGAGAEFEQHGLGLSQIHDGVHVVVDVLDEAGGALRELVLAVGAHDDLVVLIPVVVALAGIFADAVGVVEAEVEPDGGVEGAVLVDEQPGELFAEDFGLGFVGEVAVGQTPIGDGARDAVDDLLEGRFATAGVWVGAVVDVAVKILGGENLGGEVGEGFGDLDVLLFEDGLALVVGDFSGAVGPGDFVVGVGGVGGKGALDAKAVRGSGFGVFGVVSHCE